MSRSLTIAAVSAGLLALGASTATADRASKPFDLWTAATFTPGRAHVYGTVDKFPDTDVTVRARLNDVCPKDGHGAYLRVTFVLDDGSTRQQNAQDTSTCKNEDGVDIAIQQHAKGHAIKAVKLHLYEYDAAKSSVGDTANLRIDLP